MSTCLCRTIHFMEAAVVRCVEIGVLKPGKNIHFSFKKFIFLYRLRLEYCYFSIFFLNFKQCSTVFQIPRMPIFQKHLKVMASDIYIFIRESKQEIHPFSFILSSFKISYLQSTIRRKTLDIEIFKGGVEFEKACLFFKWNLLIFSD